MTQEEAAAMAREGVRAAQGEEGLAEVLETWFAEHLTHDNFREWSDAQFAAHVAAEVESWLAGRLADLEAEVAVLKPVWEWSYNGPGSADYGDHAGYDWADDQHLADLGEAVEDFYVARTASAATGRRP